MAGKLTKEEKQRRKERKKQKRLQAQPSPWMAFLGDWGRVIIPVAVIGIIWLLKYLHVIEDSGLGVSIGLLLILIASGAMGAMVMMDPYPKRVRLWTGVAILLLIIGAAVPFVKVVYPGAPLFNAALTHKEPKVNIKSLKQSGYLMVSVRAPNMTRPSGHGGIKGSYRISFDNKPVAGELHDMWHQGGGRKGSRYVEDLHSTDINFVKFDKPPKVLRLVEADPVLGEPVQVELFNVLIPPMVAIVLLILALLWATWLDTVYREFTVKMRFAPWVGAVIVFLAIFINSYEPTTIASQALWSAILGGILGFVGGWVFSIIPRLLYARHKRGTPNKVSK